MCKTYSPKRISGTIIQYLNARMHCFQNAPDYFATIVSYVLKLFMKLTNFWYSTISIVIGQSPVCLFLICADFFPSLVVNLQQRGR
jgi:hypothetical protein